MAARKVVALAGNPNVGKTCIFNNLTGARQHVGNWPGVTVEKKEGYFVYNGEKVRVVDLPGIYSLGAYSEDEVVARNYLLSGDAGVVINIIDASNLERNLYLTVQMLEMGTNVVAALNMVDEAEVRGIKVNTDKLARILGIPVVPTVAPKKRGMAELVAAAMQETMKSREPLKILYGKEVEEELAKLEALIDKHPMLTAKLSSRWLAVKLLEGDDYALRQVGKDILQQREESIRRIEENSGQDAESLIVEGRYGFIAGIVEETVTRRKTPEERLTLSDKIDKIVTHRVLGIPIFLAAMWAVFQFTFTLGDPLIGYVETFFEWLGGLAGAWITNEVLASLVVDGIIGGVGSVLVFIPPIFLLFLAISFLEDSGYMARAAYVTDRFMHTLGLHGKSFIPLLIGFGCNVPAVMATRTLENKRDRIITLLITPFMSCAARLPVYVLFVGAFFAQREGLVIFSLYLLGIVIAILMGMLFKTLFFKGEQAPFVMELPPYRMPTLKGTLIHMWERGYSFIRKAGTIIFGVVVLIWLLSNIPFGVPVEQSLIGRLGQLMTPIFAPCGFGTWEAAVALSFGILAKEAVVGTLGVVYGVGEEGLATAITQYFTPLSAYAFMAMTLLYIPCVAVIGAIKRETNWKWAGFAVGYTLAIGWIVAFLIYQGGKLLGLG
ncbi:MAG: ferrous iron transport protein B [Peptococcaceae bacterium]|nr:ferrous iron transport protein B [Peptococcaceae bacterium]